MASWNRIECADCSTVRYTRYKNTKYCELCRFLRNLKFIGERTKKCAVSEKPFAPIDRNQFVSLKRDPYSRPGGLDGECGLCNKKDVWLMGNMIHICRECVDDPNRRSEIIGLLLRKQEYIKANPGLYPDNGPPPERKKKEPKAEVAKAPGI